MKNRKKLTVKRENDLIINLGIGNILKYLVLRDFRALHTVLTFLRLPPLVILMTRLKNTKVTQMKALELTKQKTRSGRQAKASAKFDE